jgi:dimethylglycine catabolism B
VDPIFTRAGVARQLDYCSYCPKMSRHACPVSQATGHETYTPQAKMDRLNQLRRGRLPWTRDNAEPIYACTGCRHCTNYCEHGNEPGTVLFAGRVEANRRGAGHPNLAGYPDRFRNRDQRLVAELRARLPREHFADDGVVGFFPGCDAIDKGLPDIEAALGVFEQIGAGHVRVIDGGQACGGYPLLAAGYPDMFRWHATRVAAGLNHYRTAVINCSACLYTMRALYPAEGIGMNTEILSLAEFLAQAAHELPAPEPKKVVYYHDPCYLSRYAGVLEAPRIVLSQVAEVHEFGWSHSDSDCCGGAGLLPKTMPEAADAMARRRLRHVAGRGGGTVVTACATCAFMLKRNAPAGVRVEDLAGYLAATLPEPTAAD